MYKIFNRNNKSIR